MKYQMEKSESSLLVLVCVEKDVSLNGNKWNSPDSVCDTLHHNSSFGIISGLQMCFMVEMDILQYFSMTHSL